MLERSLNVEEIFSRYTRLCLLLDQFVDSNLIDMYGTNNAVKFIGIGFEDLACFMWLKVWIFGGLLCTR